MKNKKVIYVLMPIVLVVWGYIGFKIFTYGEDDISIEPIKIDQIITSNQEKPETKTLALNYPDPFLKGTSYSNLNRNKIPKNTVISTKKLPQVKWENITYNGFIKNQNNEKKIALIGVNGRQVLAGISDQLKEFEIISIQQDSVLLKKEGTKKWFLKFKQQ